MIKCFVSYINLLLQMGLAMARKRQKSLVQRTIHLSPEIDSWVDQEAKRELRSFSNMADVLLRRMKSGRAGQDRAVQ
jgi:hypothetical protein